MIILLYYTMEKIFCNYNTFTVLIFLAFRTCGESSPVLYYNNMACLYLAMGKPNLASFYLRKALHENKCALESVQVKDNGNYNKLLLYSVFM